MKYAATFLALLMMTAATPADARPVSYKGGWMAMTMNDGFANSAALLYSPTATTAIGPFVDYYRDTDETLGGLQFNWLAHRWNNPDSQGNLYLLSGAGARDGGAGGYLGMEADWEDRRYYVSYENRYTDAGEDVKEEFQQKARVGIAPYVAEAGQLHTWLMLQVDHTPEDDDNWRATPLVRLFKGPYLGEGGISNRGEVLFNFTATF
ncbi:MAG: hypothetical protein ACAH80_03785 [Alphaproteobacteria bacterium]